MGTWTTLFLPFALVLARVSAFFSVLPIFGWRVLPVRVRAGIALLGSIFFAMIMPPPAWIAAGEIHWLRAVLLLVQELLCGLGLGLVIAFVFLAVRQAGQLMGRQIGFTLGRIVDPLSGAASHPLGTFFEIAFTLFFLVVDGHHLLLKVIARSYVVFPAGAGPNVASLAGAIVQAGSTMFLYSLKLAAPLLAAFLVMAVVLAILARVLPEMNVFLTSLPLRVGLGFFAAAAIMPSLSSFTTELAEWMNRLLSM